MDVSAIGGVMLNSAAFTPAAGAFSNAQNMASYANAAKQPDINHNSLSLETAGSPFGGIQSAMSDFLVKGQNATGAARVDGQLVQTIDPANPSGMVKEIGQSPATQSSGMDNYKAAMEYAINANMVGMVLQGVTKGITALTSRGG